jgi:hypothetical protein
MYTFDLEDEIIKRHEKIKNDPSEIFIIFDEHKRALISNGMSEKDAITSAYFLSSFPYIGKAELTEDEMVHAYRAVKTIIEHGMFQW